MPDDDRVMIGVDLARPGSDMATATVSIRDADGKMRIVGMARDIQLNMSNAVKSMIDGGPIRDFRATIAVDGPGVAELVRSQLRQSMADGKRARRGPGGKRKRRRERRAAYEKLIADLRGSMDRPALLSGTSVGFIPLNTVDGSYAQARDERDAYEAKWSLPALSLSKYPLSDHARHAAKMKRRRALKRKRGF